MALRGKNQRVSSIYNLGRSQATLDFVDVDIRTDTTVFISPRALAMQSSEWSDGCVSIIQRFFQTVLDKIKAGDHAGAENLLSYLREPNETHLGLSAGRSRGRALGDGSAHEVWSALSQSQAAKSGLLTDLEDTVLLIPGVGVDIVSDITTNLIRAPLISYTQEQCRQLGIPLTDGIDSGPIWHPGKQIWTSMEVSLPLTKRGKLLLVPKAIVRRSPLYSLSEYYRHYLLVHMQQEEISAGTSLVNVLKDGTPKVHKTDLMEKYGKDKQAVIDQTFKHPEVFQEYKKKKEESPFYPLSHEDFAALERAEEPDWDGLLKAVVDVPHGTDASAEYEKAIEALLTALFFPDLNNPRYQAKLHEGRKRVDIEYANSGYVGFFSWLATHYTSPKVFIECKNYGNEVANPELDQLAGRFGPSRGQIGLLLCRQFKNKGLFQKRCRDTAMDRRGYIIALDDSDLKVLVAYRKSEPTIYRNWPMLRQRFDNLIS